MEILGVGSYFTYFIHTQTRIPSCPGQHSPHTNCEYIRVFAMFFPPVNQESRWCSLTLNTSKISWDCDIELLLCLFLHQSNFPRCIDVLLARVLVAIYYFSGTFCRLGSIWAGRPKSREYGLQSPSNKSGGGDPSYISDSPTHNSHSPPFFFRSVRFCSFSLYPLYTQHTWVHNQSELLARCASPGEIIFKVHWNEILLFYCIMSESFGQPS